MGTGASSNKKGDATNGKVTRQTTTTMTTTSRVYRGSSSNLEKQTSRSTATSKSMGSPGNESLSIEHSLRSSAANTAQSSPASPSLPRGGNNTATSALQPNSPTSQRKRVFKLVASREGPLPPEADSNLAFVDFDLGSTSLMTESSIGPHTASQYSQNNTVTSGGSSHLCHSEGSEGRLRFDESNSLNHVEPLPPALTEVPDAAPVSLLTCGGKALPHVPSASDAMM